jgi:nucleotide sugar dehydrogenase
VSKKDPTIGIIGYGFVGKAVAQLEEDYDVKIHDPFVGKDDLGAYTQDFVILCVPTPHDDVGWNGYDLSIVEGCIELWNELKTENSILVIKSTISPGTVARLCKLYGTKRIVHNPEFLTQRTANEDFLNPSEVIVGAEDWDVAFAVEEMYRAFYRSRSTAKIYATNSKTAELLKVVRNSFYALKVSFFNDVYDLCFETGVDYDKFRDVFTLGGEHPWIAEQHTAVPGPDGKLGFGGACLPKDAKSLVDYARNFNVDMSILSLALELNRRRR